MHMRTHTHTQTHRYSLSSTVIEYIHSHGCIGFCVHNLSGRVSNQPPLEVVEIMATLFCCLKDSADFSQVSGRGM